MAKARQYHEQSPKSTSAKKSIASKRRMVLEALEDRRLMTVTPDANGWYYPPIGRLTADLIGGLSAQQYKARSIAQYGNGPINVFSGAGESGAPVNTSEIEPNGVTTQAQLLPLGTAPGKSMVVNVAGQVFNDILNGRFDEDYFAVDLRAGDIIEASLDTAPVALSLFNLSLFDSLGREAIGTGLNLNTALPGASPLRNTTSTVSMSRVIGETGRYFVRVGEGASTYSLRLRAYRNTLEVDPIGTRQILFLDFNGSIFPGQTFGLPGTIRLPPMMETLEPFGFLASQENEVIDKIVAEVKENYTGSLPSAGNGYFSADGRPGAFDIDIRNSRDHADPWGLPNVSRVLIGGGAAEFPLPVRGIAQSVDPGNFNRTETAVVLPEAFFLEGIQAVPRTAGNTLIDVFTTAIGNTISHEAGHFFGLYHLLNSNATLTLMDTGGLPIGPSRAGVGPDGIFGTTDDIDIDFGRDRYDPIEGRTGIENQAQTLAYTLVTGTVGASISGVNFNDRNRNGRQDTGDEGLVGWTIYVDVNGNGIFDAGDTSATTGTGGAYQLSVPTGTFNVRSVVQENWVVTFPSSGFTRVTVVAGQSVTANFGHNLPNPVATGFKWLDSNGDGIRDAGEPGLAGVFIYIDLDGDDRPDIGEPASISKADGSYSLTPPSAGIYAIREVVESGFLQTFPVSGEHIVNFNGSTSLRGFDFGNQESSDFGDAPAPYPTTRAANGASHGSTPGLRLGVNFDSDPDGRPSANADADDLNGPFSGTGTVIDDEDGVTVLTPIVRGDNSNTLRVDVTNTTGSPAYLSAWVDFNGNGVWGDVPNERIAADVQVTNGPINVTFPTPASAVGRGFARFRLSQETGLAPTGRSRSGEVEDYVFSIVDGPRVLLQPDNFTVARNSRDNPMDVLANDFNVPGEPWTITGVSTGSQGGRILIAPGGKSVIYSPALGFTGRDTFTYRATTATGRTETTTVTVDVTLQFNDPVAVDDSFDVPTNSIGFPLSVLANDIEGRGGALTVLRVSTPNEGGAVVIGSGSQSIRYTPRRGFGGTEQFTYTATDASGKETTANITVHVVPGDRLDDEVEFSFEFRNAANEVITEVRQGDTFRVVVFVDDLRPEKAAAENPPRNITDPGVFSAYLDLLYSAGLVTPNAPTGGTQDFAATYIAPYQSGRGGSAITPGIIDELGAFIGNVASFDQPNRLPVVILDFTAASAGIAEFVGDPADRIPGSEVTFYNAPSSSRVPNERIRFGRSTIEIVPNGVNFPFAVDDIRFNLPQGNPFNVDVLTNDINGTQPPIRITSISQPANGQTQINNNNTPNNFTDDTVTYFPSTNFVGVDQFRYTITDERGFTSTATVTLSVGSPIADDVIRLRLSATDLAGTPIEQIVVGQQFQLRGFVEDLRTNAVRPGVFAAFQDVLYSRNLVSVNSRTEAPGFVVGYAADYSNGRSGDIRVPGLINEIGSVQSTANDLPTGLGEKLQWVVTLTARTTGLATFLGDPADIKPFHDSFVFNPTTPLTPNEIRYTADSILIVSAAGGGGSSGGEGNTNLSNQFDVNNDGFVSPIDVLILVNSLNTGGSGPLPTGGSTGSGEGGAGRFFVDVNGDNFLSPLDALMVINELNNRQFGGSGEGEGAEDSSDESTTLQPMVVEVPFATKKSSNALFGPLPSSKDLRGANSLDDYLAQHMIDEEEFDYLDGLAQDVLGAL